MIDLSEVVKSFDGEPILKGVDLTIETGEKVAIIGPSGCGKSTLLRLMMGFYFPDSGSVAIDGEDLLSLSPKALRNLRLKFGMLFQSAALFDSMTVAENVSFSLVENQGMSFKDAKKNVEDLLELVGMGGAQNKMPADLSGGMRKRIGLARAIASHPKIVLYDEPTTGLDPILSTQIEDLIVKLNNQLNITSVVVTHQFSTILRTADKIYLMHDGRLLPPETPETIMKSENPYIREFMSGGL